MKKVTYLLWCVFLPLPAACTSTGSTGSGTSTASALNSPQAHQVRATNLQSLNALQPRFSGD